MWLIRSHHVVSCCVVLLILPGTWPQLAAAAAVNLSTAVSPEIGEEIDPAVTTSSFGCPRSCECKWKRGKETVNCVNTGFTFIPKLVDSGTQVLDFPGNQIVQLTNDVFQHSNLLNLQEILMSRCRIFQVEHFAFRELINLVKLDLSDNALTSVPTGSFEMIAQLRELDLSGNQIERIQSFAFSGLTHLIKLEISDCRIKAIDVTGFVGLDKLQWLKLDGNSLSTLHPQVVMPLRTLHGMALHGNPWVCTCELMPLRQWMLSRNMPLSVPPICKEPKRIGNEPWDKLKLEDFACPPVIVSAATDYRPPVKKSESESENHATSTPRNVTLTCIVEASPAPKVEWLWQGHPIKNNSQSAIGSAVFITSESGRENKVCNLTILFAEVDHGGDYVCAASNKAGETLATVQMMLAKPVTTTLQQVERSQMYVIATFGGGAGVFILLFLACCVFSIQQKHPILRQGVQRSCSDGKHASHLRSDANDPSELAKLNVTTATTLSSDDVTSINANETDSNTSVKCGFQTSSFASRYSQKSPSDLASHYGKNRHSSYVSFSRGRDVDSVEYQIVPSEIDDENVKNVVVKNDASNVLNDEGYKSMSSTSSASVVSTITSTSISPEVRDPPDQQLDLIRGSGPFHRHHQESQQQKYSDRRYPQSRGGNSSEPRRPPSIDLGNLSVSSPRVRFNLKPIHFPIELERLEDFPPPRFRERSPSDPLVSFSSYLTEDRLSDHRKVRFRSSSVESQDEILSNVENVRHTCSKSQSTINFGTSRLSEYLNNEKLLNQDRMTTEELLSNKSGSGNRKQFRTNDPRTSRGRALPRVCTLPSGGFSYLQRPSEDVVISPISPPVSYESVENARHWKFDESRNSSILGMDKMDSFLKEYKSLQEELARMKEACDNLRRSNLRREMRDLKTSIFDLAAVRNATTARDGPTRRQDFAASALTPKPFAQNGQNIQNSQNCEPLNLRPILKHRSRRRSQAVSDFEAEMIGIGPESESSPMTTPSSGSDSFTNRRVATGEQHDTTSKYNSLGGHGRHLPPKRF